MADDMWGKADGAASKSAQYGKGFVYNGLTMQEAFTELHVKPDFSTDKNVPVLYTHRSTDSTEIYFITNQSDSSIKFSAAFRVANKRPQWWDAVTGSMRTLTVYTFADNATIVPVKLEAFQSGFVVFTNSPIKSSSSTGSNFPAYKTLLQLNNPWTVSFDKARQGPAAPVVFDTLSDWSKSLTEQIKNYSGTGVYHTSFIIQQLPAHEQLFIDVGNVKVMATVTLNGKNIGTVWTAPWRVDVTGLVKRGNNQLKIEVVNTWVNRLIGDSKLPAAQRKTWTIVNPYTPESPYQSAGLIGPVRLLGIFADR